MRSLLLCSFMLLLAGCASTIRCYDADGNLTKVEKATNFSRIADGTNSKSQLVLVEGTVLKFEASASAGDNFCPGIQAKFINGKAAVINQKDKASYTGSANSIEKFFQKEIKASPKDGLSVK